MEKKQYKRIIKKLAIIAIIVVLLLLLSYRFWFLRLPERDVPEGNSIVSPANGIIKEIIEIRNSEPINIEKGLLSKIRLITDDTIKEGYVIVIEMNVHNVHYQKAPLDGKVAEVKYSKGTFLNALSPGLEATLSNERNEIIIETEIGKIKVVQIAGFLARRIVPIAKKGDIVEKGETIGLIKLGSQVALVIPNLNLEVKKGDKVIEGETIITDF